MENPIVLLEKLMEWDKDILEYAILKLMKDGKIEFDTINRTYVQYLEWRKEELMDELRAAESCTLDSFLYKKTTDPNKDHGGAYKHTQECLYLLNKSNRYQMSKLNEKYKYDEKIGKENSTYERLRKLKEDRS